LGDKDNFWPAEAKTKGPNGPCGPCSEIFYDFGANIGCGKADCTPACSCGRFVEIWNLVFTQFNRKEDGSLEPLPNKNIDTGMGLERLASVIEGKQSNFETDLFEPIVKEIRKRITVKTSSENEFVYAIADHVRAVVFCIYDGVIASNEGRGYIVRKIIRKSVLHLRALGIDEPLLNKLVPLVALVMRAPYPDLKERQEEIAQIVLSEEKNFINVLGSSEELFKSKFTEFIDNPNSETVGNVAFLLHDTYGIPLELTRQWLDKHRVSFSKKAFEQAMEEQRARSKSGSAMKGDVFSVPGRAVEGLGKTQFLGYDQFETKAKVLKVMQNLEHEDLMEVVLDKTVFYAESGGQVHDVGTLTVGEKTFSVINVTKSNDVFIHQVKSADFIKNGLIVDAKIDVSYRMNVARNHTATHILQAALRKVLGTHVQQQGSLVAEDRFRFDFTHFKGLSKEEIARVEEVANDYISKGQVVNCKEMDLKEAKKAGALAFFEEKYGENVRVVSIGDISKELCGGTHIDNISKIGLIKIISEGSVASGIRRIEGVTAAFAEQFIKDEEGKAIEEPKKKDKLEELKEQEKKRSLEVTSSLKDAVPRLINNGIKINGINLVSSLEAGLDMNALRLLADKVKEELKQGVIALGSQDNEQRKAYLVIAITQDLLSKGLDAGALIRQVAPLIGGSGGGRPDFAQAGGSKPENLGKAMEELRKVINP